MSKILGKGKGLNRRMTIAISVGEIYHPRKKKKIVPVTRDWTTKVDWGTRNKISTRVPIKQTKPTGRKKKKGR